MFYTFENIIWYSIVTILMKLLRIDHKPRNSSCFSYYLVFSLLWEFFSYFFYYLSSDDLHKIWKKSMYMFEIPTQKIQVIVIDLIRKVRCKRQFVKDTIAYIIFPGPVNPFQVLVDELLGVGGKSELVFVRSRFRVQLKHEARGYHTQS